MQGKVPGDEDAEELRGVIHVPIEVSQRDGRDWVDRNRESPLSKSMTGEEGLGGLLMNSTIG